MGWERRLEGQHLDRKSGASEAGMVAEGGNTAASRILKKFKIIQGPASPREAGQDLFPPALLLVAVGEMHHGVFERRVFFGELLQTNDDVVLGRLRLPASSLP